MNYSVKSLSLSRARHGTNEPTKNTEGLMSTALYFADPALPKQW